jgi:hypothetical protein
MTEVGALARLAFAQAAVQAKLAAGEAKLNDAVADFLALINRGATPEEVELARLKCSSMYETQLDMAVEYGDTRRALLRESK